jgi:rhodanese-related sulfurtransferase
MRATTLSLLRWLALPLPGLAATGALADPSVFLTHDLPYVEVRHHGKTVRIERNPDTDNMIDPDYSLTSRPCPPYCIQPMQLAPGVETIGELEMIDYLRAISAGNTHVMVIDSRDGDWPRRSGMIPGAVSVAWDQLFPARNDPEKIANLLEDLFGARRDAPLWSFAHAKTLVFYCNGAWCGQSPTNIKTLLMLGYPANKIKWYRGGMQDWKMLGLTTVPPAADKPAPEPGSNPH